MKPIRLILNTLLFTLILSSSAQAALISRLGGDAIYDSGSDLTWIANANLAGINSFGVAGINANGSMDWNTSNLWIAAMNSANHLGYNDWRLPTLNPISGNIQTSARDGSIDQGINFSRPGTINAGSLASEMAYLFYNSLGNISDFDVTGVFDDGCAGTSCLTNTGLFDNLQSNTYWSGTPYFLVNDAWDFNFDYGGQGHSFKTNNSFALAVRSGDVSAVPVPAAVWLMGSALLGLVGFRRKNKN